MAATTGPPNTTDDFRLELTWRGILLGAAITLVFTAANVYLGLKVGLTFASSIPAAVISMAVLEPSRTRRSSRTTSCRRSPRRQARCRRSSSCCPVSSWSAGGRASRIWQSFAVCAIGGILGVMYSVPLRRALVTKSDLPYPEGVAAAEVLKVGVGSRGETAARSSRTARGLLALVDRLARVSGLCAPSSHARLFTDTVAALFPRRGRGDRVWRRLVARAGRRRPPDRSLGRVLRSSPVL